MNTTENPSTPDVPPFPVPTADEVAGPSTPPGPFVIALDGRPYVVDPTHYLIVAQGTFQCEGTDPEHTVTLWVRRCIHGTVLVHSQVVGGTVNLQPQGRQLDTGSRVDLHGKICELLPLLEGRSVNGVANELVNQVPALDPAARGPLSALMEIILSPTPVELTEKPVFETLDERGHLNIGLTGRQPVDVDPNEWPITASEWYGYEDSFAALVCVRRHADGRTIAYGMLKVLGASRGDRRIGYYLPADAAIWMVADAVNRSSSVANAENRRGWLIDSVMSQLPPEQL